MNDFIDIYCERTQIGFWDEPLNAVSNVFFLIAAFMAWRLARRQDAAGDAGIMGLVAILAMIGIGSFLFHTIATGWAKLADVIPIAIFQILFIYLYGRKIMGVSRRAAAGLLGVFFGLSVIFAQFPYDWLNGSLTYAPAVIMLGGLGIYHAYSRKTIRFGLLLAAVIFIISLTFRSLDMAVCDVLPIGVHYMWHFLNAIVLYSVLYVLIMGNQKRAVL